MVRLFDCYLFNQSVPQQSNNLSIKQFNKQKKAIPKIEMALT